MFSNLVFEFSFVMARIFGFVWPKFIRFPHSPARIPVGFDSSCSCSLFGGLLSHGWSFNSNPCWVWGSDCSLFRLSEISLPWICSGIVCFGSLFPCYCLLFFVSLVLKFRSHCSCSSFISLLVLFHVQPSFLSFDFASIIAPLLLFPILPCFSSWSVSVCFCFAVLLIFISPDAFVWLQFVPLPHC